MDAVVTENAFLGSLPVDLDSPVAPLYAISVSLGSEPTAEFLES